MDFDFYGFCLLEIWYVVPTPPEENKVKDQKLLCQKRYCGIGMLSYKLICMSYYEQPIKSITILELNQHFVKVGKKLLDRVKFHNCNLREEDNPQPIQINYVNGSMFDKDIWNEVTATLPNNKFDLCVSNPPFGKVSQFKKEQASWLNYSGERELMVLELAHRYSNQANFIIPPSSCEFQYSGRPFYERRPSKKIDRFKKANPELFFFMEADGIDASVYRDEWKGTSITTEVASISFDKSEYSYLFDKEKV